MAARWTAIGFTIAIPLIRPSDVREFDTPARDAVEQLLELLPFVEFRQTTSGAASLIAGALTVALVVGLVYLVLVTVWRWWDHTDLRRLRSRANFSGMELPFTVFLLVAGVAVEFGVFALLGWGFEIDEGAAKLALAFGAGLIGAAIVEVSRDKALTVLSDLGLVRARPGVTLEGVSLLAGFVTLLAMPPLMWELVRAEPYRPIDWWIVRLALAGVAIPVLIRVAVPERYRERLRRYSLAGNPALLVDSSGKGEQLLRDAGAIIRHDIHSVNSSPLGLGSKELKISDDLRALLELNLANKRQEIGRTAAKIAQRFAGDDESAAESLLRDTASLDVAPAIALAEATGDKVALADHASRPLGQGHAWRDRSAARRVLKRLSRSTT